MPTFDVRILGPLQVRSDGADIAVPRGNTAAVLAILLDEANAVVPLERLVHAVYGYDRPQDPETQIQNTIGVLRGKHALLRERIKTVGRAYKLVIDTLELDLLRCKAKDDQARRRKQEGDLAGAAASLREALAEWGGPALADLSGATVEAIRRRHDEYRLALLERRIDLDLDLERHDDLVEELRQIVAVHDTRQRYTAQLMRALHAGGRSVEALEAFEALRERLSDALGADPDPELKELHLQILRHEPQVHAEPSPPRLVPAMLPRANARFTGREDDLALLDGYLDAADGEAGLAVVTGMGGVGKTALAVRWAHRVAHRFPDGHLYFNLRGFDPLTPGADPGAVLGEALSVLGVESHRVPAGLDERIGLYRTVLAQRKVLVVLDNARDSAVARPLLPVAPGSFALVTSRGRLSGLDHTEGADTVPLDLLSDRDAWSLLVRRIGMNRALAEETAVRRIVASCARLPLALTLIGAWAAAHPRFSLASLASRLESTTNVFKVLSSPDLASDPRSVFACSYQELGGQAARAFRLFGLHPGPDLTVAAMASLMGATAAEAEAALAELAEVHLADQHREGRYTMHDLLRAYARERFTQEVPEDRRREASQRMLDYFVHSSNAADHLLTVHGGAPGLEPPGPGVVPEPVGDAAAAAAWFRAEYDVLLGLALRRMGSADDRRVWQLAWCLSEYMMGRNRSDDLRAVQTAALAAAERTGDGSGQVVSVGYLSAVAIQIGDQEGAAALLRRALALADANAEPWAKGFVYFGLCAQAGRGDDAAALAFARESVRSFREAGDEFWEYRALWAVGWHLAQLGELDEARECFDLLMAAASEPEVLPGIAYVHVGRGRVATHEGRYADALAHYDRASAMFAALELDLAVAFARELTGDARHAGGDPAHAQRDWRAAERVYLELGSPHELDRVRTKLAAL
ncbi:AfsR/SARP family transcriptional regulator [Glycomyces paridis]|uniref:Bacterial transcriptional activator domain-containing protein n=1 Tax=Glycomyces paridis TaxID=2126555 RepID=A0A4S8P9M4_9ACTN|nr:BTAD domain-containing putative transcriptional regulator [Glycomyces paridis]THV26978.1 hypothetical protein E9998_15955 [Glycomyces paridis]